MCKLFLQLIIRGFFLRINNQILQRLFILFFYRFKMFFNWTAMSYDCCDLWSGLVQLRNVLAFLKFCIMRLGCNFFLTICHERRVFRNVLIFLQSSYLVTVRAFYLVIFLFYSAVKVTHEVFWLIFRLALLWRYR